MPDRHVARESASAHVRAAAVSASPAHRTWLENIDRRALTPPVVAGIVRRQRITRDSFRALDVMERITDQDGKTFFVIPPGTGADDAREAVALTYILNAGTGYGRAGSSHDFPATPYGAAELGRILQRQRANRWSYEAVRSICSTGGCLVTTPNGLLMGLGGSRIHAPFSRRGGTTWGDVFLVNLNRVPDPVGRLRAIIESGRTSAGAPRLDRLLHHEEIHARQWATLGPIQMPARYLAEEARGRIFGGDNSFERDAGLSDGGYR